MCSPPRNLRNRKAPYPRHLSVNGFADAVTADTIQNSFNKAAGAQTAGELKEKLKDLAQQVAEMAKVLPPKRAEETARDLEAFTSEALAQTPRRKWYELSADGLIEAAKAVGDLAKPVIATVKAILALLATN